MERPIEREFKLRIPDEAAERALLARLGGRAAPAVAQTNHFFDTAARALGRARIALRLREEAGAFTLALKGPALREGGEAERQCRGRRPRHGSQARGIGAGARQRAPRGLSALAARGEEELALDEREARAILAGQRSPLAHLETSALAAAPLVRAARRQAGDAALLALGAFVNERRRVGPLAFPPDRAGPPIVFEFDTTRFPGGVVERELEVELPPGADEGAVERGLRALFAAAGIAAEPAASKAERFFRLLERDSPHDSHTNL